MAEHSSAVSHLAAALELRSGIPTGASPRSGGPDIIRALGAGQFLDFRGVRLDSSKAAGIAFTVNLITPAAGEKYVVELSNGTRTNLEGFLADDPDLPITITRADLELAMTREEPLPDQFAAGRAILDGNETIRAPLQSSLVHSELGFAIMPGAGAGHLSPDLGPFAQDPLVDSAGG